uniref:C2H2-type domain-containing protein n=2 Tax=Plectus sambesii TaxID=2011161 RepID=A0A914UY61_9BILA
MDNTDEPPKLERQMKRRGREPGEAAARGYVPAEKSSKLSNVSIVNDFGLFGCPICGKMFVDQKFLTRHARTEHSSFKIVRPIPQQTLLCGVEDCVERFVEMDHLMTHLRIAHGRLEFTERVFHFKSIEQFQMWKASAEKYGRTSFISNMPEQRRNNTTRMFLYCARSDDWRQMKDALPVGRPSDGDALVEPMLACPAYMNVVINHAKNSVSVCSCLAHLGHEPKRNQRRPIDRVECPLCHKLFKNKPSMITHRRLKHNTARDKKLACGDPDCDERFSSMMDLCIHVARAHGRDDICIEELTFSSVDRFEIWKRQVEEETCSRFVKTGGENHSKTANCLWRYFLCHRTGNSQRRPTTVRLRKERKAGSVKMGRTCTAFINAKISKDDGSVVIKACLNHHGHDLDVCKLPLSEETKSEVRKMLLKGLDVERIVSNIRDRSTEEERAHYISKQDVRNVAQRLHMVPMDGADEIYQQTVYVPEGDPMEGMTDAAEEVTITTDVDDLVPEAVAEVHVIEDYREENFDVQVVDDMPGAVLSEEVLDIEDVGDTDQLADIREAIKAKAQTIAEQAARLDDVEAARKFLSDLTKVESRVGRGSRRVMPGRRRAPPKRFADDPDDDDHPSTSKSLQLQERALMSAVRMCFRCERLFEQGSSYLQCKDCSNFFHEACEGEHICLG